jgi:hypothetical protein
MEELDLDQLAIVFWMHHPAPGSAQSCSFDEASLEPMP